jgi:eukaryotic-like serine/threonine-protein kinase
VSTRTRVRGSLPYVIAIIGGFLIAYLLVAFVVFPSGVIPRDAKVPSVTGLLFADASQRLAAVGFRAERGDVNTSSAAPKETVLSQTPAAGTHDAEGTTVTLDVSGGQQLVRIPNVNGLTRDSAQAALERAGFDVGSVSERPSGEPIGQVISSNPRQGTDAPGSSAVSLVVSAGQMVATVPDLSGHSVQDAKQLLESAGLELGDVSTANSGGVTPNSTIQSQSPAAGAQVGAGTRVAVRTSGGTA